MPVTSTRHEGNLWRPQCQTKRQANDSTVGVTPASVSVTLLLTIGVKTTACQTCHADKIHSPSDRTEKAHHDHPPYRPRDRRQQGNWISNSDCLCQGRI